MASFDIYDKNGQRVGEIDLADAVFAAPVREHLLWEVVVAQRASRRSGTASTKVRSEVRGSTRKLYRQKGTGRARAGSLRSPVRVGGGTVFGPKPRSYAYRPPRKVRRGALISTLSLRAREQALVVVDDLDLGEIKTRRMVGLLNALGVESGLVVDGCDNVVAERSTRNLPRSKYLPPEGLNVYDILRYPKLVVTRAGAKAIEARLLGNDRNQPSAAAEAE